MMQGFLLAGRFLSWFSCGAASAVAAKIAVDELSAGMPVEVLYCDTSADEHPDNLRFLADVERWIGQPVKRLQSPKYRTVDEVYLGEKFIVGASGAPCTRELKRRVRMAYQEPWDWHVFGFTADEQDRIDQFERENPDLRCEWVLADRGITKRDCYRMVREAGIDLPAMYKLGYKNNNCIGCCKGGAGYWNKVRVDFPEVFARKAQVERRVGYAILRVKGKPCFLDELPPNVGRYDGEPDIECGPQCVPRGGSTVKVYVASHDKELAKGVAGELEAAGFKVVSTWHDVEFLPTTSHTVEERAAIAIRDVDEVTDSHAVVLVAGPEKYSGGKFVEAGVAIGQGKPVAVLGRRENMLLWHPSCRAFESTPEVIGFLRSA